MSTETARDYDEAEELKFRHNGTSNIFRVNTPDGARILKIPRTVQSQTVSTDESLIPPVCIAETKIISARKAKSLLGSNTTPEQKAILDQGPVCLLQEEITGKVLDALTEEELLKILKENPEVARDLLEIIDGALSELIVNMLHGKLKMPDLWGYSEKPDNEIPRKIMGFLLGHRNRHSLDLAHSSNIMVTEKDQDGQRAAVLVDIEKTPNENRSLLKKLIWVLASPWHIFYIRRLQKILSRPPS